MTIVTLRRWSAGLLLLSAGACHSWKRDLRALPDAVPARTRVQVWSGGTVRELHGVRVQGDTLVGVPYWLPPACDSCAVRVSVSSLDSVRVQQPDETRTVVLAAGILAFVAFTTWLLVSLANGLGG